MADEGFSLDLSITGKCASPKKSRPKTGKRPTTALRPPGTSHGRGIELNPQVKNEFVERFDAGSLPIRLEPLLSGNGMKLAWTQDIEELDYYHMLPLFFKGIVEKTDPYQFAAEEGLFQLLEVGGSKVVPVIPQIVKPIKAALNLRDKEISFTVLRVLQELVMCDENAAHSLAKHYRMFLPVFNILKAKTGWTDGTGNMPDAIQETMEMLEIYGGEESYDELKRMVPTYVSCVRE